MERTKLTIIFSLFYIIGVFAFFTGNVIFFAGLLLILLTISLWKNLISNKASVVFYLGFALALLNCQIQIKNYDDLSQYIPANATITGSILSIPTTNNDNKTKFYVKVKSIKTDNLPQTNLNAKTLVTIYDKQENFSVLKIADNVELKGKLRVPAIAKNPSQFDYRNYLKNHRAYSVFYVNQGDWKILSKPQNFSGSFLQKLNSKRAQIIELHKKYVKSPNIEVLGGVVFGDDAINPPDEIKASFINSGLLHILAASGMNVSIIFGIWFFIGTRLRLNYRFIIFAGILLVAFYTLMTGMGASVLRAALMIEFVLLGKLIDRTADSIALVFFVAFLMLLVNPAMINDVGFQLSFIVTFALMYFCPPILEKIENKWLAFCVGSILVPLVAQLFAAPIQMFYFNTFATYSIFANLVITPFIMVISFLGFVSSILAMLPLGIFVEKICFVFDTILNPFVSGLVNISNFFAHLPHSLLFTVHPSTIQLIIYYAILLLLGFAFRIGLKNKKLIITLLALSILFVLSFIKLPSKNCEILAFDVGNADSFLIKTPQNKYIMIDTAHGRLYDKTAYSQALSIMGKYMQDNGIKGLDLLVLTHFDADHSGGAVDIMESFDVKKVVLHKQKGDSKTVQSLFDFIENTNQKIQFASHNTVIFEENDFTITSYFVETNNSTKVDDNDNSIITMLSYGDSDMLFMADAGVESFEKVKKDLPSKKIEIIKSGHHGAENTVSHEMIKLLKPEVAVISTGLNFYGHPVRNTLHTLAKNEVKILRTDVNNAIKISFDKTKYKIKTWNPEKKRFDLIN